MVSYQCATKNPKLLAIFSGKLQGPCEAVGYRNFEHPNTDTNMHVESFHNVLKTYFMEIKPNKRVDDLLNVLLTYEEDTYWRHKGEKIYATKHQSANNNSRHTRGIAIVDEDLTIVNETTWKVKSQSKGKNMNVHDCAWLHRVITIFIITITIIIVIIINPSIVLVNNILQRSMYIKTFSYQIFAQS